LTGRARARGATGSGVVAGAVSPSEPLGSSARAAAASTAGAPSGAAARGAAAGAPLGPSAAPEPARRRSS